MAAFSLERPLFGVTVWKSGTIVWIIKYPWAKVRKTNSRFDRDVCIKPRRSSQYHHEWDCIQRSWVHPIWPGYSWLIFWDEVSMNTKDESNKISLVNVGGGQILQYYMKCLQAKEGERGLEKFTHADITYSQRESSA